MTTTTATSSSCPCIQGTAEMRLEDSLMSLIEDAAARMTPEQFEEAMQKMRKIVAEP